MIPSSGGSSELYLRGFFSRWRWDELERVVDSWRNLRVLVVADLIVDEYCYCRVSGTVSKWPVLAAVYQSMQRMTGGGAAIARHVKEFAGSVHYVCAVGGRDNQGDDIRRVLAHDGIDARFAVWQDSHTVTKRRYITGGYPNPLAEQIRPGDHRSTTRLFEIGFMPHGPMPANVEAEVCSHIEELAPQCEVVIVADFGHGLMTPAAISRIAAQSPWWAVNAQTNSSNYGFNRITRYRQADYICIDELEARLPSGEREEPLELVVKDLQRQTECDSLMVTRGSRGLALFDGSDAHAAPALATTIVDTVGAGDAVLAVSSLACAGKAAPEMSVFLGACAGAVASGIVGNEEPVRKQRLLTYARERLLECGEVQT